MFWSSLNSGSDPPRKVAWNCFLRAVVCVFLGSVAARGQACQAGEELETSIRSALDATALQFFGLAAKGDAAGLRSFAIPSVSDDFSGIAKAVQDSQAGLAQAKSTVRSEFLLIAAGDAPLGRVEFLCGVFGKSGQTASSAVFTLNNLPPGRYGVVILDASGNNTASDSGPQTVSFILQDFGTAWKLGGFYVKSALAAGHDSKWFAEQARAFAAKGQVHNAWYYVLEARNLASAVPFMSTRETDRLFDDAQKVAAADAPEGLPPGLAAGGKVFKVKAVFAYGIAGAVNLVVKYEAADVSDSVKAFSDNQAVARALVAKWPELREGFEAIVARATEPSGKDFGTLVDLKSLK